MHGSIVNGIDGDDWLDVRAWHDLAALWQGGAAVGWRFCTVPAPLRMGGGQWGQ